MTETKIKAPTWFWVVAILALIWNLLGVSAYLMDVFMTPEMRATLPATEQELYENTPAWATAAYAIAVWSGALGSLLLLLRKSLAHTFLVLSFVGIMTQMIHAFFLTNSYEVFGPGGFIMPIMVIVVGLLLIVFARSARTKNWIV